MYGILVKTESSPHFIPSLSQLLLLLLYMLLYMLLLLLLLFMLLLLLLVSSKLHALDVLLSSKRLTSYHRPLSWLQAKHSESQRLIAF
jgi:hypothetical protein